MAKKKKGKVVQLKQAQQSAENYIKTQARSLPIAECWITKDWQNAGMCNVIVARRHKNENVTLGIYLVDLYCLGVKDANYQFNVSPADYKHITKHSGGVEACEYVLAHNIIYGAIAFAEDYGFKPHKDFAIAQYILEEDDENVELIELDFGFEGQPFYTRGPNDDNAKINNIKNTLIRTAGEGNFTVVEDIDNDDFVEDEFEHATGDVSEESREFLETYFSVAALYEAMVRTKKSEKFLEKSNVGKNYKLTEDWVENAFRKFDYDEQRDHYHQLVTLVENKQYREAITELEKAAIEYPDKAPFQNLLQSAYLLNGQTYKSFEMIISMYERFPGYLFAFVNYINMLIDEDNLNEAASMIGEIKDMDKLYPDRKVFEMHEAAIFYATMSRYFTSKGDIDRADLYMDLIIENELFEIEDQTLVRSAMLDLCNAKMQKIDERNQSLAF